MTTKSQYKAAGDLVIHMESSEYCCISAVLKTQAASGSLTDLTDLVGYPVILDGTDWKLAKSGDEASVDGLIVDGPDIDDLVYDAATTALYKILVHPPAIINQSAIATTDYAGASFTVATIVTALKTLKFEVRDVPSLLSTQTE